MFHTIGRTLRAPVAKGLPVCCMNCKVVITNQSSQDHWYQCLKCESVSSALRSPVVVMKPSVLGHISLKLSLCFGPQTTYLKHGRLFQNALYIQNLLSTTTVTHKHCNTDFRKYRYLQRSKYPANFYILHLNGRTRLPPRKWSIIRP